MIPQNKNGLTYMKPLLLHISFKSCHGTIFLINHNEIKIKICIQENPEYL